MSNTYQSPETLDKLFRERAGKIANIIKETLPSGGKWFKDLRDHINEREYSDQDQQAIKDTASLAAFQGICEEDPDPFKRGLQQCYLDPFNKICTRLKLVENGLTGGGLSVDTLQIFSDNVKICQDILYNYAGGRLLPKKWEEKQDNRDFLDVHRVVQNEICPALQKLFTDACDAANVTPEDFTNEEDLTSEKNGTPKYGRGICHIFKIPDEIFSEDTSQGSEPV